MSPIPFTPPPTAPIACVPDCIAWPSAPLICSCCSGGRSLVAFCTCSLLREGASAPRSYEFCWEKHRAYLYFMNSPASLTAFSPWSRSFFCRSICAFPGMMSRLTSWFSRTFMFAGMYLDRHVAVDEKPKIRNYKDHY